MGQTLGCAPVNPGCRRFINLPRSCVYGLWEAFNDIAEGFGLTMEEFQEIIKSALLVYLNVTEKVLNVDTDTVFKLFDDDEVRSVCGVRCVCVLSFGGLRMHMHACLRRSSRFLSDRFLVLSRWPHLRTTWWIRWSSCRPLR
jgi:hypothetical protein